MWSISLLKCIPKFAQATQAKDMWPIALQNAIMKCMSTLGGRLFVRTDTNPPHPPPLVEPRMG